MMELSVMGAVSLIFQWVLQCINGGLLNVLFIPHLNQTTNETTYEYQMDQTRLTNYFKSVALISGSELPLDVLESFPESIGGGPDGVKFAREHPNRESVFLIGPLAAAIIMLVAIIGLIFISLCTFIKGCCRCCCHKGGKKSKGKRSKKKGTKPETGKEHGEKAEGGRREGRGGGGGGGGVGVGDRGRKEFYNGYDGYAFYHREDSEADDDSSSESDDNSQNIVDRMKDLLSFNQSTALGSAVEERQVKTMEKVEEVMQKSEFVSKHQGHICCGCHLLTMLLAIVYVVGLVVCVVVYFMAAGQVVEVMGEPPTDPTAVEEQTIAWLGGESSHYNLPATVTFILDEVLKFLDDNVNKLISSLNSTLGGLADKLTPTLDGGVTGVFENLLNATNMSVVFNQTDMLSEAVTNLSSSLGVVKAAYNKTVPAAISLNITFAEIYEDLKNNVSQPGYENLTMLLFKFNASKVVYPLGSDEINKTAEQFKTLKTKVDEVKEKFLKMPKEIVNEFKKNFNFTEQLNELSTQINGMVGQVKPQIEDISHKVPEYVSKARPYIAPVVYSPAGLMCAAAVVFFSCLLLFLAEACHRRLFSPTGKSPSELAEAMKARQGSRVCGGCRFLVCSILLILVVVLSILAAVVLIISTFLAVEVCPYVSAPRGMNQSDCVLNSLMRENLPLPDQDWIDLAPPRNVLYNLDVTCDPAISTEPKLLPAVGITRIANLTKMAESQNISEKVEAMCPDVAKKISEGVDDAIIAQVENMSSAIEFVSTIFKVLGPHDAVVELEKFTKCDLGKLESLSNNVTNTTVKTKLKGAIEDLKNNRSDLETLEGGYRGMEAQTNLTERLRTYISTANQTLRTFDNETTMTGILNTTLLPGMLQLLDKILNLSDSMVNGLVYEVLPCGDLHYMTSALVATGCASNGLLPRFFGWALALTLATLFTFLSFVGIFNLWCIQSHQIRRFYGS